MRHLDSIVQAMIEFYQHSRTNCSADNYSHYIYSPRELTRWVRGIAQATEGLTTLSVSHFIKIFVYEAERLFSDRLVSENERKINAVALQEIIGKYFSTVDLSDIFNGPLLFTNWTSSVLTQISFDDMRNVIKEKLVVFCREEMDTKLIFFDRALEHILRIDRTFRYF
jgi:dynein heavy chain 1